MDRREGMITVPTQLPLPGVPEGKLFGCDLYVRYIHDELEIELEYDDEIMHGDDQEAIDWFYTDVLGGSEQLHLHSNEVYVGEVEVLRLK